MTHHHLSEHADAYKKHHLYLQKLKTTVAQLDIPHSPCAVCKISVKKFHSCVILKQLALLFARQHMAEDLTFTPLYPEDDDLPHFKCQRCDKMMYSANALDLHLLMHEEQTGVFDAMRDINPDYSCAHCGLEHNSHTSAMKHINDGSCPDLEWSGVEWSGVEWSGVEWSGVFQGKCALYQPPSDSLCFSGKMRLAFNVIVNSYDTRPTAPGFRIFFQLTNVRRGNPSRFHVFLQ